MNTHNREGTHGIERDPEKLRDALGRAVNSFLNAADAHDCRECHDEALALQAMLYTDDPVPAQR